MVYQDIVISPDILRLIDNSFRSIENDIDIKSYKNNLTLKKIILDKEGYLDLEYRDIINNATDMGKQQIDAILKSFLNGRIEYKTLSCDSYSTNKTNNILFSLAINSSDRIINSSNGAIIYEKINNNNLKNIEILNIEEIIKPPSESNCYSLERTINIKRGDKFVFDKIFKYYISESETVKITDKFIRKRKELIENTIKILKCCKMLKKIIIFTNIREDKDYITVAELEKYISETIGINPIIKPTGKHRRTVETDKYRIAIDPGLDFVNEYYVAKQNDVEINITLKNI